MLLNKFYEIHDYLYFDKVNALKYEDGKETITEVYCLYEESDVDAVPSVSSHTAIGFFRTLEEAREFIQAEEMLDDVKNLSDFE